MYSHVNLEKIAWFLVCNEEMHAYSDNGLEATGQPGSLNI